ncbi:MAG: Dabb family protein [Planctomycetes bacterium]|nr:Dabb family protein [Planctomycetota bacterium]
MLKSVLILSAVAVCLCVVAVVAQGGPDQPAAKQVERKAKASPPLLRHVVLFKFKEEATKEQIRQVEEAFAALPKKIDAIHDFEWGTDVSVENRSKGFTHGFLVTFRDEKGRDEYLPHPAHQEFVKLALPLVEDVLGFDYRTGGEGRKKAE